MNGAPVYSCMVLAARAEDLEIVTIEGASTQSRYRVLQRALVDHFGIQCGFCTPGIVLTVGHLLDSVPQPTEGDIHQALMGNLCRCTGYVKIVESIRAAATRLRERPAP
jgi:aerobic carbon-monoxide dehydrogenase small subunit